MSATNPSVAEVALVGENLANELIAKHGLPGACAILAVASAHACAQVDAPSAEHFEAWLRMVRGLYGVSCD